MGQRWGPRRAAAVKPPMHAHVSDCGSAIFKGSQGHKLATPTCTRPPHHLALMALPEAPPPAAARAFRAKITKSSIMRGQAPVMGCVRQTRAVGEEGRETRSQ